jgi:hypothetical protein
MHQKTSNSLRARAVILRQPVAPEGEVAGSTSEDIGIRASRVVEDDFVLGLPKLPKDGGDPKSPSISKVGYGSQQIPNRADGGVAAKTSPGGGRERAVEENMSGSF